MHRAWTLVLAALAAASCDDLRTESGDYGLKFDDFTRVPGPPPYLVLEGTRLCKEEARCGPCEEDPPICEGVALASDGAARVDGCRTVELGEPLRYTFTPRGCTTAHPPESLLVDAVAPTGVSARFDPHTTGAHQLRELDFPALTLGAAPPPPDVYTPLQILAGASVELRLDLIEHTSERVVGWNPSAGALAIQALEGPAPTVMGSVDRPTLTVATAGSRASAELGIKGLQLPLADVIAVDPDAVDHLELTALFYDGGASGMFPVGIEAHALDAAGKHILGLPVEWRVLAGDLEIDLGEDAKPSDVAGLLECIPKQTRSTRSGVIEARYGEHTAQLELTWKGYAGDEFAYNAGPCDEGCGCRGGAPGGWAGLGIGLLALGLRRRRRSITRT